MDIVLCGGGNTIIGSGEGANSLITENPFDKANSEELAIISDANLKLYSGAQTYANKKGIVLNSGGVLEPEKDLGITIGSQSKKFNFGPCTVNFSGMTTDDPETQAGRITFNCNNQYVHLAATEFDAFRRPVGLYMFGEQDNTWFWNKGDIITSKDFIISDKKVDAANHYIRVENKFNTWYPIRFAWDATCQYGLQVRIGDGGSVVIGAGESAASLQDALKIPLDQETMYLASDGAIRVFVNCNTIADRKTTCVFNANGITEFLNVNVTQANGYKQNGTSGKISAVQSGTPNTNMLWAW